MKDKRKAIEFAICSCGHEFYSGLVVCPMCKIDTDDTTPPKEPEKMSEGLLSCPFCGEIPSIKKNYNPPMMEISCGNVDECAVMPSLCRDVPCKENKGDTPTFTPLFDEFLPELVKEWNARPEPRQDRNEESTIDMDSLDLAILFHREYEKLAPGFGYDTKKETRIFDPESPNGKLMVAVCEKMLEHIQHFSHPAKVDIKWPEKSICDKHKIMNFDCDSCKSHQVRNDVIDACIQSHNEAGGGGE